MKDRKFCTACQSHKPLAGGIMRRGARTARWICQSCVERKSPSPYQSKTKDGGSIVRLLEYHLKRAA